jgi:linoleate 10R-lipoxygenase
LQALENPDGIDDREGLFVELLSVLCHLPPESEIAKEANDKVIEVLYNTLPHPPAMYVGSDLSNPTPWTLAGAATPAQPGAPTNTSSWPAGTASAQGAPSIPPPQTAGAPATAAQPSPQPRAPWAFRAADGSGNNAWMPALGQSGRPYARDVEGKQPLPPNMLPDPGLVFDVLLRSRGDVRSRVLIRCEAAC